MNRKTLLVVLLSFCAIDQPALSTNLPGLLNDSTVDCTLSATGTCAVITNGAGTVSFNLSSSGASGLTYNFQGTSDGTHWFTVGYGDPATNPISFSYTTSSATSGQWIVASGGLQQVRFNLTARAAGTLTVHGQAGAGSSITYAIGGATSSSPSLVDEGAFTEGTTTFAPVGCYFKTSVTSLTTGQAGTIACTADRMLFMNLGKVGGTAVDTNSGSKSAGTQRMVLATDQPALTNALLTQPQAATSGGCTPYHLSGGTAATTNSTNIKSTAGNLCDITPINTTTTIYYLKIYDSSAAPTCSSATNIKHVYPIPPAASTGAASGIERSLALGESYANGIGFCVTGGGTDTDNTSAATGVYIEASFK